MRSGWRCGIASPKVNIRIDSHPPLDPSQEQMETKGLLVCRLDSWQPSESPMFLFSWDSSSRNKGGDPFLSLHALIWAVVYGEDQEIAVASPGSRANTKDFLWPGASRMRHSPDGVWNIWLLAQAVGWLSGLFEHKLAWESLCRMLLEAFSMTSAN